MKGGLLLVLTVFLLAAGCEASLGERPVLPTAMAGISSREADLGTPSVKGFKAEAPPGPTSTPAPWATVLPPTQRPGAPKILHATAGKAQCMECHSRGTLQVPADHLKRKNESCLGCHSVDYSAVKVRTPAVGHGIEGREACLKCHLRAIQGARPMPGEHSGRPESGCAGCHRAA